VVENGALAVSRKTVTSFSPIDTARELMEGVAFDAIMATGYGRHLAQARLGCEAISEIKAFSIGASSFAPHCQALVDIGGQDTKAISLDGNGGMDKFEMNDKCAAGTGRFLEIIAAALGFTLEEFANAALGADQPETINSTCTVFAESEVISLINQGADRRRVSLGVHKAVVGKAASMLARVAPVGDVVFAGGVALNRCAAALLARDFGRRVLTPPDPQMLGAIGAAILAAQHAGKKSTTIASQEMIS
jgi:predicted CoA-substrate-specific enzyme activase